MIKPFFAIALLATGLAYAGPNELLNVSYDVTREFYSDYNVAFTRHWKEKTGAGLTVEQSHGGSSAQVRSVIEGLEADVVTMNQDTDINRLVGAGLVAPEWRKAFPNHSAPYSSTIVFLVRKGNPKGIKDWDDLVKSGVSVIVPNPKTSGNGRYSYLAAWAYAAKKFNGDEAAVRNFVSTLFKNVPVLETGGRAATNTFVQKGMGDVLLTFESETLQIAKVFSPKDYDIVIPSLSIAADAPVAVVEGYTKRHGTADVAREYLKYLWSDDGQKLAVKYYFRPRNEELLKANAALFPPVNLVTVEEGFGSWDAAQKTHFNDGGVFDQILLPAKKS